MGPDDPPVGIWSPHIGEDPRCCLTITLFHVIFRLHARNPAFEKSAGGYFFDDEPEEPLKVSKIVRNDNASTLFRRVVPLCPSTQQIHPHLIQCR